MQNPAWVFLLRFIMSRLLGYGASCDANHITAGLEDGSGALLAIIGALSSVMPVAEDVTDELWLVNAHATSTPRGDAAEMNCLRDLLSLLQNELKEWNIQIPLEGPFVTAHKGPFINYVV
jgi:3-oxoacyl-(acyl-carrier-protein) synthase